MTSLSVSLSAKFSFSHRERLTRPMSGNLPQPSSFARKKQRRLACCSCKARLWLGRSIPHGRNEASKKLKENING